MMVGSCSVLWNSHIFGALPDEFHNILSFDQIAEGIFFKFSENIKIKGKANTFGYCISVQGGICKNSNRLTMTKSVEARFRFSSWLQSLCPIIPDKSLTKDMVVPAHI